MDTKEQEYILSNLGTKKFPIIKESDLTLNRDEGKFDVFVKNLNLKNRGRGYKKYYDLPDIFSVPDEFFIITKEIEYLDRLKRKIYTLNIEICLTGDIIDIIHWENIYTCELYSDECDAYHTSNYVDGLLHWWCENSGDPEESFFFDPLHYLRESEFELPYKYFKIIREESREITPKELSVDILERIPQYKKFKEKDIKDEEKKIKELEIKLEKLKKNISKRKDNLENMNYSKEQELLDLGYDEDYLLFCKESVDKLLEKDSKDAIEKIHTILKILLH